MELKFVKKYFFGVSLDDTSQCDDNDICPSGSGSDSDWHS